MWVRATAAVALLAVLVLLAWRVAGQSFDDAFITYRYAQNLAFGNGLVYQVGEAWFGCTAPGFAILLAALHGITALSIPVLGTITTALGLGVLSLLLWRELLPIDTCAAYLAAGLITIPAFFWTHNGSEQFVVLALLAASAMSVSRRPLIAGGIAGLAVLCRPDALIGSGLIIAMAFARGSNVKESARVAVGTIAVILPAAALAHLNYGSPLPETLRLKRLHSESGLGGWSVGSDYWREGYRWLDLGVLAPVTIPILCVALLGLVLGLGNWRAAPGAVILVTYGLVQAVVYPVLGVPFYTWYLVPQVIAIQILSAYGLSQMIVRSSSWLAHLVGQRAGVYSAILWLVTAPLWFTQLSRTGRGFIEFEGIPRYLAYREAGEWLSAHAGPSDSFYSVEVGIIGYYSGLHVVDPLGLVSPRAGEFLLADDPVGLFQQSQPRFLVRLPGHEGLQAPVLSSPQFAAYRERLRIPFAVNDLELWERKN